MSASFRNSIGTISIFLVSFIVILLLFTNSFSGMHNHNYPENVFNQMHVEDSVYYIDFKKQYVKKEKELELKRVIASGSGAGLQSGIVGVKKVERWQINNGDLSRNGQYDYYFTLPGYFMTSGTEFENLDHSKSRYAIESDDPNKPGSVMIPIKKSSHKIIRISLIIFSIAAALFLFFVLIILPIFVLQNIAKGKSFKVENASYLTVTGTTLLVLFLIQTVGTWLLSLIFIDNIPDGVVFPFWETFLKHKMLLIGGMAVLLVARAFKSGAKLQQEQNLTI